MDTVIQPMDTVIQFIGLFVFTTLTTGGNATGRTTPQATNPNISQSVVVAIAPRVIGDPRMQRSTSTASRNNTITEATKPTAAQATSNHAGFVEAHTTMITFRLSDLVSPVVGWNKTSLKPNDPTNDWYYVELSGERVTFVADMPNANIDVTSLSQLPLRHLGKHTPLLSAYTASGNYTKAAGVFTIPKGTLSACSYSESAEVLHKRIDTRLTLHTNKKLTILGPGNKSITLFAGAAVFIGNIPMAFANSGSVSPNAHEHYKVYCEMIGVATCTWPPPPLEEEQRGDPGGCGDGLAYRQRAGHPEAPTLPRYTNNQVQASDYACSNTQWP